MTTNLDLFKQEVWDYYAHNGRDLPWRHMPQRALFPYYVFISELMLQQTQVSRVREKYQLWIERFPTFRAVAEADFTEVLTYWNGLGYNRRARYVYDACKVIDVEYGGTVPRSSAVLQQLKGIGPNTAAAIITYAYNKPTVFVETNIRTVFIYHFFPGEALVSDTELLPLIKETLDTENPREWYWALMDYGSFLKKREGNVSARSGHYKKQSLFHGSKRQLRGIVLRQLIDGKRTYQQLYELSGHDERLGEVLAQLEAEHLIAKTGVDNALPRI